MTNKSVTASLLLGLSVLAILSVSYAQVTITDRGRPLAQTETTPATTPPPGP